MDRPRQYLPPPSLETPVMIVVCAQWQSEVMTVLQGDFEEELRRMSVDRPFYRPRLRDPCTPRGSADIAYRHESDSDE
jgi:hypothetical protein